jgi:hypothetical protein
MTSAPKQTGYLVSLSFLADSGEYYPDANSKPILFFINKNEAEEFVKEKNELMASTDYDYYKLKKDKRLPGIPIFDPDVGDNQYRDPPSSFKYIISEEIPINWHSNDK